MRLKNFHTVVANTPQSLKDKVAEMMDRLDNQNLKTNNMKRNRLKIRTIMMLAKEVAYDSKMRDLLAKDREFNRLLTEAMSNI